MRAEIPEAVLHYLESIGVALDGVTPRGATAPKAAASALPANVGRRRPIAWLATGGLMIAAAAAALAAHRGNVP